VVVAIDQQLDISIPEEAVYLSSPIKTVGEHEVTLEGVHTKAGFSVVVVAA